MSADPGAERDDAGNGVADVHIGERRMMPSLRNMRDGCESIAFGLCPSDRFS